MGCDSDDYKDADRYELHGGKSNKFWIIKDKGDGTFAVWYGRCGKAINGGQYKPIRKPVAKLIAGKEKEGYVKMESKGYDPAAYTAEGKAKADSAAGKTASGEPPAKKAKVDKASNPMAGTTLSGKSVGGDFATVLAFVKAKVAVYKSSTNGPLAKALASDSAEIYKLNPDTWGNAIDPGKYYYVDIDQRKTAPAVQKSSFEGAEKVHDLVAESVAVWQLCVEDAPAAEDDPDNFVPGSLKEEQVRSADAILELDDCEWLEVCESGLRIDEGYFYWIARQEA